MRGAIRSARGPVVLDPTAWVIVAEQEGALIGCVSGSARTAFYVGGTTAWVDEILVLPEGRPVRELARGFEVRATCHGCCSVALATRSAAPFYEHLGYAFAAGFKQYLEQGKTKSVRS